MSIATTVTRPGVVQGSISAARGVAQTTRSIRVNCSAEALSVDVDVVDVVRWTGVPTFGSISSLT